MVSFDLNQLNAILVNAISAIFLLIIISYYCLLFIRKKKTAPGKLPRSISIIMPAHNEERYIADCIESVLDADFEGKKEILVVDDGSHDRTARIAQGYPVKLLKGAHRGKSFSINKALKFVKGELVAVVDADSVIAKDSLLEATKFFAKRDVGGVCSVIKVKNKKTFPGMWLHIEQLYNSLLRSLFAKVNVNIVTPGPLSIYRKESLTKIGGFETQGFSEDVDVALRLIKAGYKVECSEKSISETNMPITFRGFSRQRLRFARGWINIFKRHFRLNRAVIRIYTLPLMLFGYFQSVIMGAIMLYNIISGYINYFVSHGTAFSFGALRFFLEWLSIAGIIRWCIRLVSGTEPWTIIAAIGLAASLLTYPLYLVAIYRYDKKLSWRHIIPLVFMFPYWLVIMVFYIIALPEAFRKHQKNKWEK
jgi:cellulose synthase/poly-beta-1,6-N-acetylglucosamine synthase-like glycosyltransferase